MGREEKEQRCTIISVLRHYPSRGTSKLLRHCIRRSQQTRSPVYDATKQTPHILRYISMTRRRHLGTHINCDREKQYIKNHLQSAQIITAQNDLSTTISQALSPTVFEDYVSMRSVAKEYLGPLYQ